MAEASDSGAQTKPQSEEKPGGPGKEEEARSSDDSSNAESSDEAGEDDGSETSSSMFADIEIREALEILDMARVLHALESSVARLVEKKVLKPDDPIVQNIEIHTDGIAYYLSECGVEPDCSDLLAEGGEEGGDECPVNVLEAACKKGFDEVDKLLTKAADASSDTLKGCIGLILGAIQRSMKHREAAAGTQYVVETPNVENLDIPTIEYVISDLEALNRVFKAKQFFPQTAEATSDSVVEAISEKMNLFWNEIRRRQRLDAANESAPPDAAGDNPLPDPGKREGAAAGQDGGEKPQEQKMTVNQKIGTPAGKEIMVTLETSSKSLSTVVSATIRKLISFRQIGADEVEMAVPRKRIIQALTKNILDHVEMRVEDQGDAGNVESGPLLELLPTFVDRINLEVREKLGPAGQEV